MTTNRAVIVGLFVFWAIVVALLVAGFISAENQITINELSRGSGQRDIKAGEGIQPGKLPQEIDLEPGVITEDIILDNDYVRAHNTLTDCWMIISGKVYDVTEYVPLHPGGVETIKSSCGADGTQEFKTKGESNPQDHSDFAYTLLENYYIGTIGDVIGTRTRKVDGGTDITQDTLTEPAAPSQPPAPTPTLKPAPTPEPTPPAQTTGITAAEVAQHSSISDCWMIMEGKVYDFSAYAPLHPGGTGTIRPYCGDDGTSAFNGEGHSSFARSLFANYYVGVLAVAATSDTTQATTDGTQTTTQTEFPAIEAQFPGAKIDRVKYEDDGRAKVDIIYQGDEYEVKLNSAGEIVDIELDD